MNNSNTSKLAFWASAQLYLSLSLLFGTWVIYIPHMTEKLEMSEGQLGFSLFFGAVGSLIATPIGKFLCSKYGEGRIAMLSILSQSVFMVALFLAPSFYFLCAALFLAGFCGSIFQIGTNAMVIQIEKKYKTSIMSSCHGFFSLGALIASGIGTIVLIALNNPLLHMIISASIVLILQLTFKKIILPIKSKSVIASQSDTPKVKKNKLLFWLALIAVSAMVTEGAIADWSGLYLQDIIFTNKEFTGLGYAGFSLSMTIGRLFGDYFSKRYGALQIIIGGFAISLVGFLLVFYPNTYVAIIGFAIIGSGFSIIVPEIYRMSANIDGVNPASGIAFMAAAGYVGFLAGPVILGVVAETFGLAISFMGMFALVFMGTIIAIALKLNAKLKIAESY